MLCDFLMEFEVATRETEATKHPTLQVVVPWFFRLLNYCEVKESDSAIICNMKNAAYTYLSLNVSEHITDFHKVATFLTPSLKPLRMYSTSTAKNEVLDAARETLDKLIPKDTSRDASNRTMTPGSSRNVFRSQAMVMFESDNTEVQEDDEDEIQRYINHHVPTMEVELLDWYVYVMCINLILSNVIFCNSLFDSLSHCFTQIHFQVVCA